MNFILSSGHMRQIKNYAKRRISNLFDLGIKDSTVFCLGESKETLEANIKTYVDTLTEEIVNRGYTINPKAYYHVRRFYIQVWSERVGCLSCQDTKDSLKRYDAIKLTLGCTYDGIPSVFCHYYPVDTDNTDGKYVQPEYVVRVPLLLGNGSIYRNRLDNKAAIFMFGISEDNLLEVRKHLERDNPAALPYLLPNTPVLAPTANTDSDCQDDDFVPDNVNHTSTIVEAIQQKPSTYV